MLADGARVHRNLLSAVEADALAASAWNMASAAGWICPRTPRGKPFSVRQCNFGPLGWISDSNGYRYEPAHPETGAPWPSIPAVVANIWERLVGHPVPECCLVNHYAGDAKMGLHTDADEDDLTTAIVSISLGQSARFRLGGKTRKGPTRSIIVDHGDVLVMGGASRQFYHGIDRLMSPGLWDRSLPFEGRLNLTLRRVTRS